MDKKILLFTIVAWSALFVSSATSAQIDFTKYLDENSFPLIDAMDHLEPSFKWNMKGNVQVYMNEGINFLQEEDLELAATNFDEVLKLDSTSSIAYYYRGVCKKKQLKFNDAKKDLVKSKQLNSTQAETYIELGEVYHLMRDLAKASTEYEKAIALNPLLAQAYYNLGSVAVAKGDVRKGLRYYQKCNEVNPKFPQAYVMQGVIKFLAKKKDSESIALFDKAITADSAYSLSYFWKGLALISLDKPQETIKTWNKVVQFNPENTFYTLMRGCLYIELGDFDNAFNDLRKALRNTAVDEERFVAGQTILDKKIDLQFAANYLITNGYGLNEEAFAYLKKGYCLLLSGKKKEALDNIKKAEQVQPSATVYFLEAIAYEHSEDHNSAFAYYNKALKLDNDNFDAHKKRSVYRTELKDWKGANEDFREMFRLQPQSPAAYRLRGLSRSNEGNYKGAIEDLNRFIKTDSLDYEVIRTRSSCYLLLGQEREANEDVRRLIKIGNDWGLYETVANNYLTLQDTSNAIEIWKEFAAEKPGIFIPHMELARIYMHRKNWDSARVQVDRAMPLLAREAMPQKYSELQCWDGTLDFHQAKFASAITKFTLSLKTNSNNLQAKYLRAKSYEKTGEAKKAIADLKDLKNVHYGDSELLYKALAKKD